MQIFENESILDLNTPYLNEPAVKKLRELFIYRRGGDSNLLYRSIEEVAASLHNATFGSIIETMVDSYSYDCAAEFDEIMVQLQRRFKVKGVYFGDDGFLGFNFNDSFSAAIQIGEPCKSADEKYGRCIPYFRHRSGEWIGRATRGNRLWLSGNLDPGPKSQEFIAHLEERLEL